MYSSQARALLPPLLANTHRFRASSAPFTLSVAANCKSPLPN